MLKGRCRGYEKPDVFFPEYDAPSSTAWPKENLCARCPVRVECLDYAMETDQFGVWGGTSEAERRSLKRPRKRTRCIGCQSDEILEEFDSEVCLACGLSWLI